eukprot:TRINITY_DN3196_c0_g2_i2.p1 TRINITY_DN3196_c0_g2~~TRINITY_DN3196_c0_g2_i2.p1  ORF type:complete len:320 (-),score=83.30 TRINITY_DN3196_c0_g2_i2:575-1501(-)
MKRAITVGVVGIPNVGKSSLINSLKRAKVASVGNKPGVTRGLQEVQLDKNVTLLDSPGIVFQDGAGAVLRNAVALDKLDDPIAPVFKIVERVGKKNLMKMYKVSNFEDADEFLKLVASVRGKMKKGGTPDLEAAALVVLQDWNDGRLPYYTLPPQSAQPLNTQIVSEWSKEFDVDEVYAQEKSTVIAELPSFHDSDQNFIQVTSSEPAQMATEMDDDEEEAEDDKATKEVKVGKSQSQMLYNEIGQYNPLKVKAERKKKRRKSQMDVDDEDFDFKLDWGGDVAQGIEVHQGRFNQLESLEAGVEEMQQ